MVAILAKLTDPDIRPPRTRMARLVRRQVDRTIDWDLGRPYLTGLSFTRVLTILDLAADNQGA